MIGLLLCLGTLPSPTAEWQQGLEDCLQMSSPELPSRTYPGTYARSVHIMQLRKNHKTPDPSINPEFDGLYKIQSPGSVSCF